MLQYCTWCYRT